MLPISYRLPPLPFVPGLAVRALTPLSSLVNRAPRRALGQVSYIHVLSNATSAISRYRLLIEKEQGHSSEYDAKKSPLPSELEREMNKAILRSVMAPPAGRLPPLELPGGWAEEGANVSIRQSFVGVPSLPVLSIPRLPAIKGDSSFGRLLEDRSQPVLHDVNPSDGEGNAPGFLLHKTILVSPDILNNDTFLSLLRDLADGRKKSVGLGSGHMMPLLVPFTLLHAVQASREGAPPGTAERVLGRSRASTAYELLMAAFRRVDAELMDSRGQGPGAPPLVILPPMLEFEAIRWHHRNCAANSTDLLAVTVGDSAMRTAVLGHVLGSWLGTQSEPLIATGRPRRDFATVEKLLNVKNISLISEKSSSFYRDYGKLFSLLSDRDADKDEVGAEKRPNKDTATFLMERECNRIHHLVRNTCSDVARKASKKNAAN